MRTMNKKIWRTGAELGTTTEGNRINSRRNRPSEAVQDGTMTTAPDFCPLIFIRAHIDALVGHTLVRFLV